MTTLDLAATFIVLAGGTVPSEMNSTSLLPVLKEPKALPPPRDIVHSGLMNFRVVIKTFNQTLALKLVCCKSACPGSTPADRAEQIARKAPDEIHLFNVAATSWETTGRFEPPELDLARSTEPTVSRLLAEMATLLPAPDHRPSFNWPGCDLSGWPGGPPAPPQPAPVPPHMNLTGAWRMLHGDEPTEIVQGVNGSLRMPEFKPDGQGKIDGRRGWFVFGANGRGENLTLTTDTVFNTIHWSNNGLWRRV